MDDCVYYPTLNQNVLNGTVDEVYPDYSILIGTVNVTDRSNYYPVQNYNLNQEFNHEIGNIDIEISQYTNMNGKVEGQIESSKGNIYVIYRDNLSNVGARFTGDMFFNFGGFNEMILPFVNSAGLKYGKKVFESNDFTIAFSTYDMELRTTSGTVIVSGESY